MRLTDLAATKLNAWLAAQTIDARTANEALNLALESLLPAPIDQSVDALRRKHRRLDGELNELRDRSEALRHQIDVLETSMSAAQPIGAGA